MTQHTENDSVKKVHNRSLPGFSSPCIVLITHLQELEALPRDAEVYKLIGPALVKQEPDEAKSNVSKRLEFIQNELYGVYTNVGAINTHSGSVSSSSQPD